MKKTIIIMVIFLVAITLALDAKSKQDKLQENLKLWDQFRWEGILQAQSSAFSMRKNFVLAKKGDELRLDVLDSGVMGLQAKPLAVVYVKDKIYLEAPTIEQLAGLDLNWFLPKGTVSSLMHFSETLSDRSKEIIKKRKTEIESTVFGFDKKMRLSSIKNKDAGMEVSVLYNNRNIPTKVKIKHAGEQLAELQINNFKHGKFDIVPLQTEPEPAVTKAEPEETPQPEGNFYELNLDDLNLNELLDSLHLEDLDLKTLLDSIKLKKLKLKETELDSLNIGGESLKDMTLEELLKKLEINDIKIEDLLKDLDLEGLLDEKELQNYYQELLNPAE